MVTVKVFIQKVQQLSTNKICTVTNPKVGHIGFAL